MPQSGGGLKATSGQRVAREPLRVGVILAEHFTLSAFAVFIDHLRLAADEGGDEDDADGGRYEGQGHGHGLGQAQRIALQLIGMGS